MKEENPILTNQKVYFDGTFLENRSGVGRDSRNLLIATRLAFGQSVTVVYPRIRISTRTVANCSKPTYSKFQKLLKIRSMITKKPEILYIESNSIFIQSHLHCVSLVHDPSILYIVRLHDVFPITHPEWFQYRSRTMFKVGFRGAAGRARFVCDSKSTFKDLTQLTSLEEVQGSVAYCPVLIPNNEMCSSCEGCIATEDNLPHIIGISTIEPRKNYLELLNSWRISKAYESTGTCLFLIGGKGWKSRKVRKMITKYGTNIGIRWIKNACDGSVQRLLLDSKIYVSASLSEGFNLSAAEAIMQRVPAIISDNDVHLELYKNHATFYKSGNPEDLAAKIQHHLSGVECFSETSNEGFQLFDYEGQVAELANALIEQTAGRNI